MDFESAFYLAIGLVGFLGGLVVYVIKWIGGRLFSRMDEFFDKLTTLEARQVDARHQLELRLQLVEARCPLMCPLPPHNNGGKTDASKS